MKPKTMTEMTIMILRTEMGKNPNPTQEVSKGNEKKLMTRIVPPGRTQEPLDQHHGNALCVRKNTLWNQITTNICLRSTTLIHKEILLILRKKIKVDVKMLENK